MDQQEYISQLSSRLAIEYNDDFVGIASYNIFVGIAVATIFGSAFFFDLFWPLRHESQSVRLAWKICSVLMCAFVLGDAIALTVIVASHSANITGVDATEARRLLKMWEDKKHDESPLSTSYHLHHVDSVFLSLDLDNENSLVD